jgi:hypothetical protein
VREIRQHAQRLLRVGEAVWICDGRIADLFRQVQIAHVRRKNAEHHDRVEHGISEIRRNVLLWVQKIVRLRERAERWFVVDAPGVGAIGRGRGRRPPPESREIRNKRDKGDDDSESHRCS